MNHRFQRVLREAGLRRQRFHDLRHACASLLLAQGVSPRVVREVLGHSQVTLTLNTYSHVIPTLGREAAGRMDEVLTAPSLPATAAPRRASRLTDDSESNGCSQGCSLNSDRATIRWRDRPSNRGF